MNRKRLEYWRRHILALEEGGISAKAYAKREGLSLVSLYRWRKRLEDKCGSGETEGESLSSPFMSIELEEAREWAICTLRLGAEVRLELSQLPRPEWLIALSVGLASRGG